jgi:hypothetical protein
MKRALLLFFLLAASVAGAQTYIAFPDSNAIWRQYHASNVFPTPWSSDFQYTLTNRDTVINGNAYSILRQKGWSTQGGNFGDWDWVHGAIREVSKRIYFVQAYDTTQHLLYDFNISLGDTLPATYNNEPFTYTVTGIDSILIGPGYHKRYEITDVITSTIFYIIEGIGSERGLMETWHQFESGTELTCFSINSQTLFPNNAPSSCDLVLTGLNEQNGGSLLSIYPNPASDILTISSLSGIKGYSMYSTLGGLVKQARVSSSTVKVEAKDLPKGIYLLLIEGEGTVTAHRIILD